MPTTPPSPCSRTPGCRTGAGSSPWWSPRARRRHGPGAGAVRVELREEPHDVELARPPAGVRPRGGQRGLSGRRRAGRPRGGVRRRGVRVDVAYRVPPLHNHPMEPHATTAHWDGDRLTVYTSSQGGPRRAHALAQMFGLPEEQITRGRRARRRRLRLQGHAARRTWCSPRWPRRHSAARSRSPDPPQMLSLVGHRTPTLQRLRLGADPDGRLTRARARRDRADVDAIKEFVEQRGARRGSCTPRRTGAPPTGWSRWTCRSRPGCARPASARACSPWSRPWTNSPRRWASTRSSCAIRNEPDVDPEPASRSAAAHLVACLREGARRFGWADRDPAPGRPPRGPLAARDRRGRRHLSRHRRRRPPPRPRPLRRRHVHACGSTRPTSAPAPAPCWPRSPPTRSACRPERVRIEIGRQRPARGPAGRRLLGHRLAGAGPCTRRCAELAARARRHSGAFRRRASTASADTEEDGRRRGAPTRGTPSAPSSPRSRVDTVTGEIRVRRMLGVFAAGRILNPRTARSQFLGGMIMGLGMALHRGQRRWTPRSATYAEARPRRATTCPRTRTCRDIEAHWMEEDDPHLNPMGGKGIGEIGIVGAAAAVGQRGLPRHRRALPGTAADPRPGPDGSAGDRPRRSGLTALCATGRSPFRPASTVRTREVRRRFGWWHRSPRSWPRRPRRQPPGPDPARTPHRNPVRWGAGPGLAPAQPDALDATAVCPDGVSGAGRRSPSSRPPPRCAGRAVGRPPGQPAPAPSPRAAAEWADGPAAGPTADTARTRPGPPARSATRTRHPCETRPMR